MMYREGCCLKLTFFDKAESNCLNDADCTAFSIFNWTAVFVYRDTLYCGSHEIFDCINVHSIFEKSNLKYSKTL